MTQSPNRIVPEELWQEILEVLRARQVVSLDDGEDEDNDYEVMAVLRKMEELK